jgi:hypothetical protein
MRPVVSGADDPSRAGETARNRPSLLPILDSAYTGNRDKTHPITDSSRSSRSGAVVMGRAVCRIRSYRPSHRIARRHFALRRPSAGG